MNNLIGLLKEKLGRSVYKIIALRPVAETQKIYPVNRPDAKPFRNPTANSTIRVYQTVAGHYFKPADMFWKYKKDHTYEIHLENTSIVRGESKIQYVNYETGAPIAFEEIAGLVHSPKVLSRMLKVDHINAAALTLKSNTGLVLLIVLFGFGLTVGLLLGMNSGAITNAIHPTPSPTPFGAYP